MRSSLSCSRSGKDDFCARAQWMRQQLCYFCLRRIQTCSLG